MRRLALLLAMALPGAEAAGPPVGRLAASFCVATSASAPPSCGEAWFEVRSRERARVTIADIEYRLHLRPGKLEVVTMHGAMQIDAFRADYAWSDGVLRFVDPDKGVRYEVRPYPPAGLR